MKKLILIIFLFILSINNINALEIERINIYAESEIAGGLRIRELIVVNNQDEDINLNIYLKNKDVKEFDGTLEGLENSDIYNATSLANIKVKKANNYDETKFGLDSFVTDDFEDIEYKSQDNKYEYNIIIPNNNIKDKQIYYLDYVVTNVLVEHNDCSELNYKFLYNFNYDVKSINILFAPPYKSDLFKVWAHGTKNIKVIVDKKKSLVQNKIENYRKEDYLDNRILFDKELFTININKDKKSNLDVIDKITEIENKKQTNTKITNNLMICFGISMILLVLILIVYVFYRKIYLKK